LGCGILFAAALVPESWLGRWSRSLPVAAMLLVPLFLVPDLRAYLGRSPRAFLLGLLEGLAAALVLIPVFFLVVGLVWRFKGGHVGTEEVVREAAFQVAAVAIPEEIFFRAFLQAGLEDLAKGRVRVLGTLLGWGWLAAAAVFALAHLPARPEPAALLVFFPGLAFGWLWARRRSLAGPVVLHALANVSLIWVRPGLFS
jgi:membrane protease YdiL (CAAX protease family)